MGITIDDITVADEPEAWRAAGFTVDEDGTCRAGHVRIRLAGRDAGKRIVSWSLRDLDPGAAAAVAADGAIDGLTTTVGTTEPPEPAAHPNGVELIDHLVLATPDQQRTITSFQRLGLEPRRTRETDQYGAPFLQTFFRTGEVIVELIGPATPSGDGPAGFFGLAFTVADLDETVAFLGEGEGVGAPKDAVQPGRRIATMRHKTFGVSIATALMSAGPDAVAALDAAASERG